MPFDGVASVLHLRLHRAEVKYEAPLAVAHPDMPLIRRSPRSRGAIAIDALLGGHANVAADALAFADHDERGAASGRGTGAPRPA